MDGRRMTRSVFLAAITLSGAVTARPDDCELFDDGVAVWARFQLPPESEIIEDAVPVSHNGIPVNGPEDCVATEGAATEFEFRVLQLSDQYPGTSNFPETRADVIANTFLRSTYQLATPVNGDYSAKFGTSVVGSSSYRVPGGTEADFRFIPTVTGVDVETGLPEDQRIRSTITGDFGSDATLTTVRTFPEPVIGRTVTGLWVEFEALQDITLDDDGDPFSRGNDAFRFITLSSMYSTSTVFDANMLRYEDVNEIVQALPVTEAFRNLHLFDTGPVEVGSWFELVKGPGSTYSPNSPTIRVAIDEITMNGSDFQGLLGVQGFLFFDPNEPHPETSDSLSVWLEWVDAPATIPQGTALAAHFTVTAVPEPSVALQLSVALMFLAAYFAVTRGCNARRGAASRAMRG